MGKRGRTSVAVLVLAAAGASGCTAPASGSPVLPDGGVRGPTRDLVLGQLDLPVTTYPGWEVVDADVRPDGALQGDSTQQPNCTGDVQRAETDAEVPSTRWSGSIGTDTLSPSTFRVDVFDGVGDFDAVRRAFDACPTSQAAGQQLSFAATAPPALPEDARVDGRVGYVRQLTTTASGGQSASSAEVVYLAQIGGRTLRVAYRSVGRADTAAAAALYQLAGRKAATS